MTARSRRDRNRRRPRELRASISRVTRSPTGLIIPNIAQPVHRPILLSGESEVGVLHLQNSRTLTCTLMAFTFKSTARLPGGHQIPLLGLGVYQNYDARSSVLQALEAGYRHIDSAQSYRNEEAVGQGVAQSSVRREDVFISEEQSLGSYLWRYRKNLMSTPCPLVLLLFFSE